MTKIGWFFKNQNLFRKQTLIVCNLMALRMYSAVLYMNVIRIGMYRNVQECTGIYTNVQECTGMYRNVQECTGTYRNVQECTGMYTNVHECT